MHTETPLRSLRQNERMALDSFPSLDLIARSDLITDSIYDFHFSLHWERVGTEGMQCMQLTHNHSTSTFVNQKFIT
jgi:hypothetical protein